ncbi:universal stress protein [Aquihabitans sp. McL0605]|uniref:universal stress protein n=1 Tax=Aquihabitans sp. McL0605 TaxID=3415671 RepID=UPI003CEEE734
MTIITVGFDGSRQAHQALEWAADTASASGARVHVIRTWAEPMFFPGAVSAGSPAESEYKLALEDLLDAIGDSQRRHPGVEFTHTVSADPPAPALLDASGGASMLVVGARGRGGFGRLLLGSVSQKVAARAECPVVVVRGPGSPRGDVVVGVSGSEEGRAALAWAAEQAGLRSVRLRCVLAWSYLLPQGLHGEEQFQPDYTPEVARSALETIVAEVLGPDPAVEIELESPCELAAKALIERSEEASLLVVGPREGRHPHLESGSVTLQVLHHAAVPVAIVHQRAWIDG